MEEGDVIFQELSFRYGTFGTRTSLDGDTPDDPKTKNVLEKMEAKQFLVQEEFIGEIKEKHLVKILGTIKFRTPDGTEISNTAEISRGYKSGYNIIQTGGT